MSTNNNKGSRPYGLLASVKATELTSIRVAVRRRDVKTQHLPPGPILRDIDNPRSIVPLVHIKKGNILQTFKTIFDREGILVNQIDRATLPETIVRDCISESSSGSNSSSANFSTRRSRSFSRGRQRKVTKYDRRSADSYKRRNSPKYESIDRGSHRHRSADRSSERKICDRKQSPRRRSTARDYSKGKSVGRGSTKQRSIDRGSPYRRNIDRGSPYRRSKGRGSPISYSPKKNSSRHKSIERRRSTDRHSSRHKSTDSYSSRYRSTDRGRSPRIRYIEVSQSRYKSRSPRKKSSDSHSNAERHSSSYYRKSVDRSATYYKEHKIKDLFRERDGSRSYSKERENRERKRSITPLKPGEYRPNHPDLKKKLGKDDIYKKGSYQTTSTKRRASNSIDRNREAYYRSKRSRSTSATYSKRHSRSPEPYKNRYHSPPDISQSHRSREYDRARRHRRSRSKSPQPNKLPHFGDPFRYYEDMPPADFWIHPGSIRPGFPIPRYYPPAFFPSGIPPVGSMIYPQRYPIIPPMIRQKFPIYNNRQKPKIIPVIEEDNANGNNATPTEKYLEEDNENINNNATITEKSEKSLEPQKVGTSEEKYKGTENIEYGNNSATEN